MQTTTAVSIQITHLIGRNEHPAMYEPLYRNTTQMEHATCILRDRDLLRRRHGNPTHVIEGTDMQSETMLLDHPRLNLGPHRGDELQIWKVIGELPSSMTAPID
ncbi:hypothetical protein Tco_1110819 [Tanacetum coccineum]|uniref:Uncharacterized protein n=1 Tax=Tanacetum coccineum TaxID=301880 RepID=A0ABQ5IKB9_9ASTR